MTLRLVRALKIENPSEGGTTTDPFPTEVDPTVDFENAKGIAFESSGTANIQGVSGVMQFQDAAVTTPVNLSQLLAASSTSFANSGTSYNSTNVQASLVELRQHPVFDLTGTATTNNGTLTLTATSNSLQYLTGTGTPFTVALPSALTLFVGTYFQIYNSTSNTIQINDGSGAALVTLAQNSLLQATLMTNGTSAGLWVYSQSIVNTATGIINYNVVSSTAFASSASVDTAVTGFSFTPQAGTYGVWMSMQATGSTTSQTLDVTIYKAGAVLSDSKRTGSSPAGSHIFFVSTLTVAQFSGSQICAGYINPNGTSVTINQRSLLLVRLGN